MLLSINQVKSFQEMIYSFYAHNRRSFAWRLNPQPYYVLVSEIMLQQTQTYRVNTKFEQFINTFESFFALAQADMQDVFFVWQGLGYNRRAKALHTIAQRVIHEHAGILPNSVEILQTFPGIGYATASSICAFAFNMPTIFIETNIRTVFIHTFFPQSVEAINDKVLLPLIEQTLDRDHPREWYYALMDYGVYLKKAYNNPSRRSAHHTKQSRFQGSDRQIRGAIIRYLAYEGMLSRQILIHMIGNEAVRVERIIDQLILEGLVSQTNSDFISIRN